MTAFTVCYMGCPITCSILGISTLSIAWQTPLSTIKSGLMMFAPLIFMFRCRCQRLLSIRNSPPEIACKYSCCAKSAANSFPSTTWKVRISFSFVVFCIRASRSVLGIFAKASSVGAKTVNGPGLFRVSTSPAALTAATSVLKLPAEMAVSTISGKTFHLLHDLWNLEKCFMRKELAFFYQSQGRFSSKNKSVMATWLSKV